MKKINLPAIVFVILATLFVPVFAYASLADLQKFIGELANIIGVTIVVLLAGVIFVMFLVNIIKLMKANGDAKDTAELKSKLIWNIILLFSFVAIWGIISLLSNFFGIGLGGTGVVPILSGDPGSL